MGARASKTGYGCQLEFVSATLWQEQHSLLGYCSIFGPSCPQYCNLSYAGNPNLVMALAANKADLDSKRKIEAEVGLLLFGDMPAFIT
jgi:hypothetical protein